MRYSFIANDHRNGIWLCRSLLSEGPMFLDTETTGLGEKDQVVEVSIVNMDGYVLFDSLVRPTVPIAPQAARVHGISAATVANAPTFPEVLPKVLMYLHFGSPVIIYNADFDLRILRQSAEAHGMAPPQPVRIACAMRIYARYWGQWDDGRQSYRWQSLAAAAQQQGIELPEGITLHRARADAELTRLLVEAMAQARLLNERRA